MYYEDKLSRMVLYQTVRDCPGIQEILAISSSLGTSMDHPRSLLRRCECSAVELVAGVHEVIMGLRKVNMALVCVQTLFVTIALIQGLYI